MLAKKAPTILAGCPLAREVASRRIEKATEHLTRGPDWIEAVGLFLASDRAHLKNSIQTELGFQVVAKTADVVPNEIININNSNAFKSFVPGRASTCDWAKIVFPSFPDWLFRTVREISLRFASATCFGWFCSNRDLRRNN